MNKKMFIVMISMLAVFFLAAQTCQMQGVTTGIARDCVGENDIVCDDTEAYQCQLAQFGVGYYVTRAPGFDVECGGEAAVVPVCINRVKDGRETDVDCGGPDCRGCLDGFTCTLDRDCAPFFICDSTKVCVEDPTVDLRCTATDSANCEDFACDSTTHMCYTSCTANDAECQSGDACSTSGTECLEDANGDGVADVEETTTAPTTATCTGPSQSNIDSTVLGTVVYTAADGTVTTVSDTCEGDNLYQVFCNAGSGYTARYGPIDCTNFGSSYTCETGICTVATSTNQDPIALCSGIPLTGTVGETLMFDAIMSYDPDGAIVNYLFNYGDGNSGASASPNHAYTTAGTYTVTLTVTDEYGATGSCTSSITISSGTANTAENCNNAIDDDGDGLADCADVTDCCSYYDCLDNEYCSTSSTTAETCTETDGGYDIYETGTTTKGTSTYTDSCSSGKLTEYWCSNDEIKSSSGLNCAITAFPVCYQGACVEECGIDTDCDPGESCDSSTHTCEEEDHSYLYSKLNNDDYIKFKLADLSSGYYTTSRLGYLTSLTLEGIDYTTSAIAHVSVDNSGGDNYFDFTSSSTPRYINFEDTIEKPEHWLYVSADVKVDVTSLNSNQIILAQLTSTAGSQLYALLTKNGKYVFKISVDNTVYEVECSGDGPDTTWQEVVGLYTGDNIEIFVGGYLCGKSPASGAISSPYSNGDFVVGYSTLTEGMQFKGYLDDIYIYGE